MRRAIAPNAPLARYSGYVVWRGLLEESSLSRPVSWPSGGGLWIEFVEGYRLVAAILRGRDVAPEPGRRQVTFAWLNAHRSELLRRAGRLTPDDELVGTLGHGAIDTTLREELLEMIPRLYPYSVGVRSPDAFNGAPIAEYRPARLAAGPLAIVGDAALVVTPMTGSGYATGVDDAAVLAALLASQSAEELGSASLARYEEMRLPYVRALVKHSIRHSAEYLRHGLAPGHVY